MQRLVDGESVVGEADGRLHEIGPGEPAMGAMGLPQAHYRSRHASGEGSVDRTVRQLAVGGEEHVAGGGRGSLLAIVEREGATVRKPQHHEPAAADVARGRVGHGQCQGRGHGSVNGVTARFQNLEPDSGGVAVRRNDDPAGTAGGNRVRRRLPAGCLRRRRSAADQEQQDEHSKKLAASTHDGISVVEVQDTSNTEGAGSAGALTLRLRRRSDGGDVGRCTRSRADGRCRRGIRAARVA